MSGASPIGTLAVQFAALSMLAIGGASAVIPEMHRQAVDVQRWMTDQEFADLFAIAQAAPGPNVLVVTLVGWRAAGVLGALVATAAMCLPTCLLTYAVSSVWDRFREARWRALVQAALAPITAGLISASAYLLCRAADRDWITAGVTAVAAVVAYGTRLNPLWVLAAAAALGVAGVM
ncbi:chromate transporter [Sorangium sp. So ce131]|uniref:chromate transporter n=1 Tax=Sorangium sp. So ce131 TaxID=3133282 RepID=UPI003F5DA307